MTQKHFELLLSNMAPVGTDPSDRLALENEILRNEVMEMRARVAELERLAHDDTLTPLPNRRYFLRELDRVIGQVERYGTPAALLFLDVDGLKRINDTGGHRAGDAALLHVALRLKEMVRAVDVVARIGGDEFALILDHLDLGAARAKARAMASAIAETPARIGWSTIKVSVSVGITRILVGDTSQTVLARADAEMYAGRQARAAGRAAGR